MLHRCFGRPVTSAPTPDSGQTLAHGHQHPCQVVVAFGGSSGHHLFDLGVPLGVQRGEGQVLQLPFELLDAQAVGQGRVDVECLLRRPALLPVGHDGDRPHVVQPVGQLDDEDTPVVGHGHEHLPDRRSLLRLLRVELEPVQLGDPVDDGRHLGAE